MLRYTSIPTNKIFNRLGMVPRQLFTLNSHLDEVFKIFHIFLQDLRRRAKVHGLNSFFNDFIQIFNSLKLLWNYARGRSFLSKFAGN